jgi:hypothetical protein
MALRCVLRPSWKPGALQQSFFGPEMPNAVFHQLLRLRQDEKPTHLAFDQQQQTVAILEQAAVKGVDLSVSGLENVDPLEVGGRVAA